MQYTALTAAVALLACGSTAGLHAQQGSDAYSTMSSEGLRTAVIVSEATAREIRSAFGSWHRIQTGRPRGLHPVLRRGAGREQSSSYRLPARKPAEPFFRQGGSANPRGCLGGRL